MFTVLLPCSSRELMVAPRASFNPASSRSARVLVMDDEEGMRLLLKRLIERMGHVVVLTEHGTQALAAYSEAAQNGERFDLVILDLTIPGGMGGFETMQHLRQFDPDVTAIVSSGYASDPVMGDYEKHGFKAVVPKSYSLEELRRAVESLLKNAS
jgi:CheY-like chemotaxis protein